MSVRFVGFDCLDEDANGRTNDETYRLFTTILDPDEVSALDLAAVYTERREIETAFDEPTTHQRGPRTVLRSKSPDLVLQRSGATSAVFS